MRSSRGHAGCFAPFPSCAESAGTGPVVNWLSIGIGVNLSSVPAAGVKGDFVPISLVGAGGPLVTPEDFLTVLASSFATQEA